MNWDSLRSLAEGRPWVAAIAGAVSLAGAGVGVIASGVDVLDLVEGRAPAAVAEAERREATAIQAVADAASAQAAAQADAKAWATAVSTNSPAAYDFYLQTFPAGAFVEQAKEAQARLTSVNQVARGAPFALESLHPTVATAVAAAREAAREAAAQQTQAERAANMATAAAAQARNGARGYGKLRMKDRDTYEGEVSGGKAEGLGVYVQGDAPFTGDRFQGQLVGGAWNGVGVYEAANPGVQRPARYGGEFTAGRLSGAGVIMRPDGVRQAGAVVDGALNGHGVETRADGSRLEGEFRNGAPEGFCALWSADGALIEAGRYEAGALVQPLRL